MIAEYYGYGYSSYPGRRSELPNSVCLDYTALAHLMATRAPVQARRTKRLTRPGGCV